MALFSLATAILALALSGLTTAHPCKSTTFKHLTLKDIQVLHLNVTAMRKVQVTLTATQVGSGPGGSTGDRTVEVDYCRIALQYTHPGQHDTVNTYIGLPMFESAWNNRFLMNGGGGWRAGDDTVILAPVAAGFASSSTDGGHNITTPTAQWGLVSEGNVNWPALQDFSSVALDEAATLGKMAANIYFGSLPKFSYWNGCSTGGRQGHMMAQRYPKQFDGIVAGCPAINWQRFIPAEVWPVIVAQVLDIRPPGCVLDTFKEAAITACDEMDGVMDGIISDPSLCDFDPYSIVGQTVHCENPKASIKITTKMASLIEEIWRGPTTRDGKFLWYGLQQDANMTLLLNTACTSPQDCKINPFSIAFDWVQVFLNKTRNPSFTLDGISRREYEQYFRESIHKYGSVIGTDDPDLAQFKKAGGKMITWHGMQDPLIMPNGTIDYYKRVLEHDVNAADFYRLFLAPGVGHCGGGVGFDPSSTVFDAIRDWVESDKEPETLTGFGQAVGKKPQGNTRGVELCSYPKQLRYKGLDPNKASSFTCR
ncbi:Tannase/feruloyl esterase [Ilyonectria sp. MPI-CAGE-AT-0026]|nr:Tannase/feruloyl esterase [Ilyonectria sp. MPI-CAGE-AT-0026]